MAQAPDRKSGLVRLRKTFFILLCLGIIFGEVFRFSLSDSISLRFLDIIVGFIAIFCLLKFTFAFSFKAQPVFKWILTFVLICILSLIINDAFLSARELWIGSLYLIRFVSYSLLLLFFLDSKFTQSFKDKLLLICGGTVVIGGYLQCFFYNSLQNLYYLGWDDHKYRLFSVFLDPNYCGIFLVLFALYLLKIYYSRKRVIDSKLVIVIFCLTVIAILLTTSRSSLLAFFVGSLAFFYLLKKTKKIIYVILVVSIFLLTTSPFFYLENINPFRLASTVARVESIQNAGVIIRNHLISGVGFNTYRYAQIKYGFRMGEKSLTSHADSSTDNSYLFVLATTGIFGLIAYLGMQISMLYLAYQRYLSGSRLEGALFVASFASLFISSLFINSFFYPINMLWLWMCFANCMRDE